MTDREAIEVLKMDCDLITFDPTTGESIDLETVKLRNNLSYICYLANKIAISALQEREERSRGCEFCRTKYNKEDWAEYYPHDFRIDDKALLFNDSKFGWEGIKVCFCPMCGRQLKED